MRHERGKPSEGLRAWQMSTMSSEWPTNHPEQATASYWITLIDEF